MGSRSAPTPPPLPKGPPPPPRPVDPEVIAARQQNRQRAALAQGRGATILTSAQGLPTASLASGKTVLGA